MFPNNFLLYYYIHISKQYQKYFNFNNKTKADSHLKNKFNFLPSRCVMKFGFILVIVYSIPLRNTQKCCY